MFLFFITVHKYLQNGIFYIFLQMMTFGKMTFGMRKITFPKVQLSSNTYTTSLVGHIAYNDGIHFLVIIFTIIIKSRDQVSQFQVYLPPDILMKNI